MALRRLVWERSWFAVILGLIALGGLAAYCVEVGERGLKDGDFVLPLLALPVPLLLLRRGFTGSRSKRQLWVDVAAGKLVLPDGGVRNLDEIGELSIEKRYMRPKASMQPFYLHLLRAASIEQYVLYSSAFESETQRRLAALDAAVVQSALRQLLERPQGDGAFRAAPEVTAEIASLGIAVERALPALRTLARDDHDSRIRADATKLAAELTSRQPS